jgi:hypothetical protein
MCFIEEIQYAGKTSLLRMYSTGKAERLFIISCISYTYSQITETTRAFKAKRKEV